MKLTENFSLSEFECKSGATMPEEAKNNIVKLANQLQIIRNYFGGRPIKITSGYRSPEYTKALIERGVKTSLNSQHVIGKAADIKIKNVEPKKVFEVIETLISSGEILQGGLGLYNGWVHYDIRKTKARWDKTK